MSIGEGRRLWDEYRDAPFPPRLRREIEGVDMVLLDADIAGCVSTWVHNWGKLDDRWQERLRMCLDEYELVLPHLQADEREYFEPALRLAQLALT